MTLNHKVRRNLLTPLLVRSQVTAIHIKLANRSTSKYGLKLLKTMITEVRKNDLIKSFFKIRAVFQRRSLKGPSMVFLVFLSTNILG